MGDDEKEETGLPAEGYGRLVVNEPRVKQEIAGVTDGGGGGDRKGRRKGKEKQ